MQHILITGSSGYVASEVISKLLKQGDIFPVDRLPSPVTSIVMDIGSEEFTRFCSDSIGSKKELVILHLAAARFDFGVNASDYFRDNVEVQRGFLGALESLNVKMFVHISSVAAIDGARLEYSAEMSCDDAYRSTKYLQEQLVERWCTEKNVDFVVLYPSAIFSEQERSDTNIGKLVKLTRYLPFIPRIPVRKSLTYLPNFSRFILKAVQQQLPPGRYLTIENPVLTVSEMMHLLSEKGLKSVSVPFFEPVLYGLSYLLYAIGGFGRIDTKLTPNRVKKLFSDTSYSASPGIDRDHYQQSCGENLTEILQRLSGKDGENKV